LGLRGWLVEKLLSGHVELARHEQLLLKVGLKSCLGCGYLSAMPDWADSPEDWHEEIPPILRTSWLNDPSAAYMSNAHCYRRKWDNVLFRHHKVDDALTIIRNIIKPRICGRFFPYSEGAPADHISSHISRTNRRWLVLGGLLGPYIATVVGFIASEVSRNNTMPTPLIVGAVAGFLILFLMAVVVNLTVNR
jgi:hypothetical protein